MSRFFNVNRNNTFCNSKGSAAILALVILLLSAYTLSFSKNALREASTKLSKEQSSTPLYLPDAKYIRLITLGFDNFFSDILWFNTINYFGKEYEGKKNYRWLGHMCDLVTQLDGKAQHVYEFCGTMLSWVAKKPKQSNKILRRGVESLPNSWRLRYMLGFNYWYFIEDKEKASEELSIAAKLPDCPPFVAAMASRLIAQEQDPEIAYNFLQDMIKNSSDARAKDALTEKLKHARISVDKKYLLKAMDAYQKRTGEKITDLTKLIESKIIKGNLQDPFGGNYFLDANGDIQTSSGEKGLEFKGKTARTGIAKKEWEDTDE